MARMIGVAGVVGVAGHQACRSDMVVVVVVTRRHGVGISHGGGVGGGRVSQVVHGHNVVRGRGRAVRASTACYQFFQAQVLIQRVHLYNWPVPAFSGTACRQPAALRDSSTNPT